jgi:gp32 DNA binding protein like
MVMSRRQQHEEESVSRGTEKRSVGSNGTKSTFKYQARTAEHVKVRAEQQGGMYDNIFQNYPTFKAKVGNNLLRVLPPTWDKADHYGYDIYRHESIGPDNSMYLCLKEMKGEACPVCEERSELDRLGETKDAAELKPRHRVVVWIVDRDQEKEGPMIWDMSWTMDKDIAALSENKRTGEILLIDHPDEGYDFEFSREGTTMTNTKYVGKSIARRPSPINDDPEIQDQWLNFITEHPIPTVLNFYSYEHIASVFSGKTETKDTVVNNKPEERIRGKSLREEIDDEIPEKSEAKSVTTRRRVTAAEPEEEEAEEEEAPFETNDRVANRGTPRQDNDNEDEEQPEIEEQPTQSIAERTRARLEERRQAQSRK